MIIFWIISFLAEKFSRQVSNVVGKRHLYCGGSDGGKLFIWNWIFKRKGSEARPRSHCFAKTLARSRINQLHVTPLVTDWLWGWSCCQEYCQYCQYFLRGIQEREVVKTCFGLCHLEVFRSCGFCPFMFTENFILCTYTENSRAPYVFRSQFYTANVQHCILQFDFGALLVAVKKSMRRESTGSERGERVMLHLFTNHLPRWVQQPPRSTPQVRSGFQISSAVSDKITCSATQALPLCPICK